MDFSLQNKKKTKQNKTKQNLQTKQTNKQTNKPWLVPLRSHIYTIMNIGFYNNSKQVFTFLQENTP